MALSITAHTLEKLEQLLRSLDFRVRYEKGRFKTGSCVLADEKIIVINKFSTLEAKIQSLAELIRQSNFDEISLQDNQKKLLLFLKQTELF